MKRLLSAALTAAIVGSLVAVPASTMAQDPAEDERSINPAGLNADKVDGKHAVGYTLRRAPRSKKLIAANRKGMLPPNSIQPLWKLIQGVPAALADGVVSWNEIVGKPAPPTITIITRTNTAVLGVGSQTIDASCNAGEKVTGGGVADLNTLSPYNNFLVDSYPLNASTWRGKFRIQTAGDSVNVYALCMSVADLTLAGRLTPAAQKPARD